MESTCPSSQIETTNPSVFPIKKSSIWANRIFHQPPKLLTSVGFPYIINYHERVPWNSSQFDEIHPRANEARVAWKHRPRSCLSPPWSSLRNSPHPSAGRETTPKSAKGKSVTAKDGGRLSSWVWRSDVLDLPMKFPWPMRKNDQNDLWKKDVRHPNILSWSTL